MAQIQQSVGGSGIGISSYDSDAYPVQISFPCECCKAKDLLCNCGELAPCDWLPDDFFTNPIYAGQPVAHATLSAPGCALDGSVIPLYALWLNCGAVQNQAPFGACSTGDPRYNLEAPPSPGGFILGGSVSVWDCTPVFCYGGSGCNPAGPGHGPAQGSLGGRWDFVVVRWLLYVTLFCARPRGSGGPYKMYALFDMVMFPCEYAYYFENLYNVPNPPYPNGYTGKNCANALPQTQTYGCGNASYYVGDCYDPCYRFFSGAYGCTGANPVLTGSGSCLYWTSQQFQLPLGTYPQPISEPANCPGRPRCMFLDMLGCSQTLAQLIITP